MRFDEQRTENSLSKLEDWELFSAYLCCKNILEKKSEHHQIFFEELALFLYDGDFDVALKSIEILMNKYRNELIKRRLN